MEMTKRKTILIGGVAAVILSAAGWFLAKPESGEYILSGKETSKPLWNVKAISKAKSIPR
jgi:hypothetical protein